MTEYMVLLHGNEQRWAEADDAARRRAYDLHGEFSRLAAERGHRITGGAELATAATATIVRGTADGVSISEGPYAETIEQLGGYYLVETEDLPDLLQLLGIISDGEPVEVRPTVTETEDLGATTSQPATAAPVTPEHTPQEADGPGFSHAVTRTGQPQA